MQLTLLIQTGFDESSPGGSMALVYVYASRFFPGLLTGGSDCVPEPGCLGMSHSRR